MKQLSVSKLRHTIRLAIRRKCKEDPQDRFRIIGEISKDGIVEVQVQWDAYDLEILSVKIPKKLLKNDS